MCCFHVHFSVETLKLGLVTETRAWLCLYGKACAEKYNSQMCNIFSFIEDMSQRLSRPVLDLDDIKLAMEALKEIREQELLIDMAIGPIEVKAQTFKLI